MEFDIFEQKYASLFTISTALSISRFYHIELAIKSFILMYFVLRLVALEEKIRDPGSIASIDSLLDTVTALISDCTHDPIKQLKNIEAYTSRCKWIISN